MLKKLIQLKRTSISSVLATILKGKQSSKLTSINREQSIYKKHQDFWRLFKHLFHFVLRHAVIVQYFHKQGNERQEEV